VQKSGRIPENPRGLAILQYISIRVSQITGILPSEQ